MIVSWGPLPSEVGKLGINIMANIINVMVNIINIMANIMNIMVNVMNIMMVTNVN